MMKYKIFIKQSIIFYGWCLYYLLCDQTHQPIAKLCNLFYSCIHAVFRSVSLALRVRRPQGEEQGQALRPQEVRLGP